MAYHPSLHHRQSIRLKGYDYSQAGLYFITLCVQNRLCLFGHIVGAKNASPHPNTHSPHSNTPTPQMILNEPGQIAHQCWLDIPKHFSNVVLHEYIIMPNHVHGIIELVEANNQSPVLNNNSPVLNPDSPILGQPSPISNNHSSITNLDLPELNNHSPILNNHSPGIGVKNGVGQNGAKNDGGAKNVSPLRSPSQTIGSIVRGFKIGVTNWFRSNGRMEKIWQRNYWEHIIRDERSYHRISEYIRKNPENWAKDTFHHSK